MSERLTDKQRQALEHAFKVALSMTLCYWFTLAMDWEYTLYGAYAIIFCSLQTTGATVEKGLMRFVGTCIGLLVSFAVIGAVGDDRWLMMIVLAAYLFGISWGMQASRYSYAWYVGGFVPLVVWSSNYPNFDTTFTFGVYRWLETVAGIVSYSVVDVIFWPRTSGAVLKRNAGPVWKDFAGIFQQIRRQLSEPQVLDIDELRADLINHFSVADYDLQQSLLDTPEINNQRKTWRQLQQCGKALMQHFEAWRESAIDCRQLPMDRVLPGLQDTLNRIDRRLEQIQTLWNDESRAFGLADAVRQNDADSVQPIQTVASRPDPDELAERPLVQQAVIRNFVRQLNLLDHDTEQIVLLLRRIAGFDAGQPLPPSSAVEVEDVYEPRMWNMDRLCKSLYPPLVWISTFLFWVYFNPPTGAGQVQIAGTVALMVLNTSLNPAALLIAFIVVVLTVVAPVNWLLMPAMSSPVQLLLLIFVYTFVFTWLGSKSPVLKLAPIVAFFTVTSISNAQTYSFNKDVDAALMFLLAIPSMYFWWYAVTPMDPERALKGSVKRFFHGCGKVCDGFAADDDRSRRRALESLVLPSLRQMRMAQPKLRNGGTIMGSHDELEGLVASLQSVANQLVAVNNAYRHVESDDRPLPDSLGTLASRANRQSQDVFQRWLGYAAGDLPAESESTMTQLENEIDSLRSDAIPAADPAESRHTTESTTGNQLVLLGSLRGLARAMIHADRSVQRIAWQDWTAYRF